MFYRVSVKAAAIFLIIVLFCGALLAPVVVPPTLFPDAYSSKTLSKDQQEKIRIQIDVQKYIIEWIQIVFAAMTAAGLIGTLWYSAKNYRISNENLRVTEHSKFSEAYIKAIEFLGGDGHKNRVVGAIYALGRLGLGSPDDDRHVITLICDYVRRSSPYKITADGKPAYAPGEIQPDVQAVLNVLRTRKPRWDNRQNILNLEKSNLSGGDLSGANLKYAILEDCDLRGINLRDTDLRHARMARSLLDEASLQRADPPSDPCS